MNKKVFYALLGLLFFLPFRDAAANSLSYGYTKYFSYHSPKELIQKNSLYPFPGPVIEAGQDIPICSAARGETAYQQDKSMRYIKHGREGWLFRTLDFDMDFEASPLTMSYLRRLNRTLGEKGQTLFIVFPPPRAMAEFAQVDTKDMPQDYSVAKARKEYKDFIEQLQKAGVKTVDLAGHEQPGFYLKGDHHWSPEGAAWTAQHVAQELKKLSVYDLLPKQEFETTVTEIAPPKRGNLEDFVQQVCAVNIEATSTPVQVTTAKDDSAADLLGDAPFPLIALIGTSNTAKDQEFNFGGELKKNLHTDAYEAALIGGGFGEAALRYYASEEYHKHPPKIIVWEFFPQHNYNNSFAHAAFRQMIPAIQGPCTSKEALASWSGVLKEGETDILHNAKNVPLRNSYLYLETDPKKPPGKLVADILYTNGEIDNIDLTRSQRLPHEGKYYLELGSKTAAPASFFHLISDGPEIPVTARLCSTSIRTAGK